MKVACSDPLLLRYAGRSGTAYSLFTREELPYLLDLHLFLSRPVQPAPAVSLSQAAAVAEQPTGDTSLYGLFPQVDLQARHEHVRRECFSWHLLIWDSSGSA